MGGPKPPQQPLPGARNRPLGPGNEGPRAAITVMNGTRPLSRALQKVWVFRFFDPGPGASGGPRKVSLGYPWAFPGPPEASRRPPGPKTDQSKKPRNLKELTERWRRVGKDLIAQTSSPAAQGLMGPRIPTTSGANRARIAAPTCPRPVCPGSLRDMNKSKLDNSCCLKL